MRQIEREDNELISSYLNGDESALKELIEKHQKRIFTYILLSVNNRELAEDIFRIPLLK